MADRPQIVEHRRRDGDAAVLFLHGYGGDPEQTWGRFPRILAGDRRLEGWDLFSLGYTTSLAPDLLRGLWKAAPDLRTLGDLLRTACGVPPLDRYGALAIVAHSMGGLVAQQALLDPGLRNRTRHLVLFGTPSGGLGKASVFSFWKRQIRDMAVDGPFIRGLRSRWADEVGDPPPFAFWPVAGDQDEFVPRTSSLDPFTGTHHVIPGDHLSIVKPGDAEAPAVQLVLAALTEGAMPSGPLDSARRAVEQGDFASVVERFGARAGELDDEMLVTLALALDGLGRRDEAVTILEERAREGGTDVLGTLAGRLKRRWVGDRRRSDAEMARDLYRRGHARAADAGDHGQAYYHAINLAFLDLLFAGDVPGARRWADRAREHARARGAEVREKELPDTDALWREATLAEAALVLGETREALDAYRRAVALEPEPWQALSTFWQGRLVADALGDDEAARGLEKLFGAGEEGS